MWGVGGFMLLLLAAIYRLTPIALEAFFYPLTWYHWLVLLLHTVFMAYSEGYRGFQQGYSPRLVARACHLQRRPTPLRVALAPLFCMGYFHTTKRRMTAAYALTVAIVILIVIFQRLPQPWRGVLDAGVVIGLLWGVLATSWFTLQALRTDDFTYSPEVPLEEA